MKRLWFLLAAIACAGLLLLWWTSGEGDYVNLPPTAKGPWVAFGDSLTEGYGATEGNNYPALLGSRLGIGILNKGRSGDTTGDGLKRLDEVVQLEPRVVLLCLGGNDSLNQQSKTQTFANLSEMIDRLHRAGSFVVLIGIRSASLRDRNEPYFKQLSKEKHVLYVPDLLKGVAFKPIYMSDAVHPNDEGYKMIAERLEKVLRPVLPKLESRGR